VILRFVTVKEPPSGLKPVESRIRTGTFAGRTEEFVEKSETFAKVNSSVIQ
jgi:hypothetical protein